MDADVQGMASDLAAAGFDMSAAEANPEAYVLSFCPMVAALKNNPTQYCTGSPTVSMLSLAGLRELQTFQVAASKEQTTCSLAIDDETCTVPGMKAVCCDLMGAYLKCDHGEDQACMDADVQGMASDLAAAGFDMSAAGDNPEAYVPSFCPMVA